jgi:5-methylthioribose kinase
MKEFNKKIIQTIGIELDENAHELLGCVTAVDECKGGLFNKVHRLCTEKNIYVHKQFMNGSSSGLFHPPEIPPSLKVEHSVRVQNRWRQGSWGTTVQVPEVIYVDSSNAAYIMEGVISSTTLLESLKNGIVPETILKDFAKSLAMIHNFSKIETVDKNHFVNAEFRDFKLSLQYDGLQAFLGKDEYDIAMEMKRSYCQKQTHIVHGDLNSNNILLDSSGKTWIIDFEQSHLGDPAYDVAYILSEIVICLEIFYTENQVDTTIGTFIKNYIDFYNNTDDWLHFEIGKHLQIQVLYRFLGPSKAMWTGHITNDMADRIIRKSIIRLGDNNAYIRECLSKTKK